jgi:hypothetical protein
MQRILLLLATTLSVFYLNTAVIMGSGGPGERLVIKPLHGIYPYYGGGEEGSWIRSHPGEKLPWWHHPNEDYIATIIATSTETTAPMWNVFYGIGYYLWILSITAVGAYGVFRITKNIQAVH